MRKWVAERYTEAFQKKSGGKTMALKKYKGWFNHPHPSANGRVNMFAYANHVSEIRITKLSSG